MDSTEASGESFDAAPDVTNQEQVEVVDLFDEINIVEESSDFSNQKLLDGHGQAQMALILAQDK